MHGNRDQIITISVEKGLATQCDAGVCLHSKTHPCMI